MSTPQLLELAALLETGRRVLPDRLEHAHPGRARSAVHGHDEAVLDETLEDTEHVVDLVAAANGLGGRTVHPPAKIASRANTARSASSRSS